MSIEDPLTGEIRTMTPDELEARRFDRRINWATVGFLAFNMVALALMFLVGVFAAKWGWL